MATQRARSERLKVSNFKLDSLLDITQSINANLPVEELLSKYENILRKHLGIGKIMIFMKSDAWNCILNAGFNSHLAAIKVESGLLNITEITTSAYNLGFESVDIIIPVYNNNICLAYVFIGDIEEEGEGVSPVIKHLNFIETISSIIIVAIENIRLVKENLEQEALRKELELASRMQKMLIPDPSRMPVNEYIRVTGFYFPHSEVGGDYYDCIRLSDTKTGFCIADVSGKGIAAAILMSNFQASFRALFTDSVELEELVVRLNSIVSINAAGEKFITFFVARYDHADHILEYVNAAHNPPVLYNTSSGEVQHLKATCVGLGMLDEIPSIESHRLTISGFNKIICYTDGLSELRGDDGKELGTSTIIKYVSNDLPANENIADMMSALGLPDNNPDTFDDVSVIAADLMGQ